MRAGQWDVQRGLGWLWAYGRRWLRRRVVPVAAVVLAVSLPVVAWVPAASAEPLSWPAPSLSQVRAWAEGAPVPRVPRQWSGTAAGLRHYVPAAATRAGRGRGRAPGRGKGQLPVYRAHRTRLRRVISPSAPDGGFHAGTSQEVASDATATTDFYQNADGTYTEFAYAGPVNYLDSAGNYRPIDTTLTAAAGGRWQETANSLAVDFAPRADDPYGAGESASFSLAGAAPVVGTVSGRP